MSLSVECEVCRVVACGASWLGVGVRGEQRRGAVGRVGAHTAEGQRRELAARQLELRPLVAPGTHRVAPPAQLEVAPRTQVAKLELLTVTKKDVYCSLLKDVYNM